MHTTPDDQDGEGSDEDRAIHSHLSSSSHKSTQRSTAKAFSSILCFCPPLCGAQCAVLSLSSLCSIHCTRPLSLSRACICASSHTSHTSTHITDITFASDEPSTVTHTTTTASLVLAVALRSFFFHSPLLCLCVCVCAALHRC
jgi:hypothetical protein